jgi:hypothetical protein
MNQNEEFNHNYITELKDELCGKLVKKIRNCVQC